MSDEKFALVYNDPRLQMERFDNIEDSQARFEELAKTAVENLMFVIIIEEAENKWIDN